MRLLPRSLFGRTAATLALTMFAFLLVSMAAAIYFVMVPMAKRSANDFAAELVSAAHSLEGLPEAERERLAQQLLRDHGLIVAAQHPSRGEESTVYPYLVFFRRALERLTGQELPIIESESGPLLWVDMPVNGKTYRLGFDRGRLGVNPPLALVVTIVAGAALTLLAALFEVRGVTRPLEHLSSAVQALSGGRDPDPVPEEGPGEIAALAQAFNKMAGDLRQMAENRTVMISGISHDLRTPLTRMALAVEMLGDGVRPSIVSALRRDIDVMNRLIGQFLQFSRGAEDSCPVQIDLWQIIDSLAADLRRSGADVVLHRGDPPCVFLGDPEALERILSNLLKNAAHYGQGSPIDVTLRCNEREVAIEVADRGPGIPADQVEEVFRPFRRLESSRRGLSGGSGLGLAIARQFALKYGWTIELLPRAGGGTVARLGLPPCQRFGLE